MPNYVSYTCITYLLNCGPLSNRMRAGQPCGKTICSIHFVAMVMAHAFEIVAFSVHRVKYLDINKIYLFLAWELGKGPTISDPINSKGSDTVIGWSRLSLECGDLIY